MSWKKFERLFKTEKPTEAQFILGIDLGDCSSALAFFDSARGTAELIDISGGYGKPSVPTVVQYVQESNEWVFGEYALLNKTGEEITVSSLISRLGKREYLDINHRTISVTAILGLFIKELLGQVKSINPNSEVAGIVVAVPSYFSEEAKEEISLAFKASGFDKEVIELAEDRACVFTALYKDTPPSEAGERLLLLDFGSRELRGSVYLSNKSTEEEGKVNIRCISSLFEQGLGTASIEDTVNAFLTGLYCEQSHASSESLSQGAMEQLAVFTYQHKDLLFQKGLQQKPVKLYYNFSYPPFQKTVTKEDINQLIHPFKEGIKLFIQTVLEKRVDDQSLSLNPSHIDKVICTGGGFEMLWARELLLEMFPQEKVLLEKSPKALISEGAAILAAQRLNLKNPLKLNIEDENQLKEDMGIFVLSNGRERFVPIVEQNSFWWQRHKPKYLILNESTDKTVAIEIYTRDSLGNVQLLNSLLLEDFPIRQKGTSKISIKIAFKTNSQAYIEVRDCGFGELFPPTGYKKIFVLQI